MSYNAHAAGDLVTQQCIVDRKIHTVSYVAMLIHTMVPVKIIHLDASIARDNTWQMTEVALDI